MKDKAQEAEALDYYRKLVSFIYREVGAMKRNNHPELYDKSTISKVHLTRKKDAKGFYHKSKSDNDVELIDQYYVEWFGLTLQEVYKVFDEGDWLLSKPSYSYGGPKWAGITQTTLDLRNAVKGEQRQQIPQLIEKIKGLCHNNGLIVDKFKELC